MSHCGDFFDPTLTSNAKYKLEIVEQPKEKTVFRYMTELQGTPHGRLTAERSTSANKVFPSVRLYGYEGIEPVKITCWLVDKSSKNKIRPHYHDLVVKGDKSKNEIIHEPHEVYVNQSNKFTAVFENLVLIRNKVKNSEDNYEVKLKEWNKHCSKSPVKVSKKEISKLIKDLNCNEVCLYFEAVENTEKVLCSVLSNPIKNSKNPELGYLKIKNVFNNCGSCEGNTRIILFTEKVPADVKIKFFDLSKNWEVEVMAEIVHYKLALTVLSPKFPFHIKEDYKVKFCLYREKDGFKSNEFDFTYQPTESYSAKRRCLESNNLIDTDNENQPSSSVDLLFPEISPVTVFSSNTSMISQNINPEISDSNELGCESQLETYDADFASNLNASFIGSTSGTYFNDLDEINIYDCDGINKTLNEDSYRLSISDAIINISTLVRNIININGGSNIAESEE